MTSTSGSGAAKALHRSAAMCGDCSTESSTGDVDLARLTALRPEWPGFADVVAGEPAACPPSDANSAVSLCDDDRSVTESPTKNSDADQPTPETVAAAAVSGESSRSATSRPVILEALLRSSSRLDANKGSSAALVLMSRLPAASGAFILLLYLLWTPYAIAQTIIFLPCGFFFLLSSSFFLSFSSPILSRLRFDVYHTSTHDVALVRI